MPDYIYLLENRLSPAQQSALNTIREAAREAGMTVFLTGGAVRDLTSGSPVRDLDLSVQGNALALKPRLKSAGAVLWGEHAPSKTIFARFPGSVRAEVSSTRREEFPKPGKPVYHPGNILEDLRRRDFTANAMALSLNEGSYGLLMDPLNGVADLEARLLRLVSNYGFLEDPIRLVRAARLQARLGWELEEKTKVRFDNAKEEGVITQISAHQQGYEVGEIVHEEDGLKILKALEADGWMKALFPAWASAKADPEALEALREVLVQLQMQGVNPDASAAQAQLLTARLPPRDVAALKKMLVRQGFVREWESQEDRAKELAKRLTGKEAATPSAAWKLLTTADPEAVLWLGLTSKSAPVQEKFKDFFTVWPQARQRIPYTMMQEMRITPELAGYQELVKSIFFELIDGRLTSEEEIRHFLEPHSPPAPPPPVSIRRPRAKKSADKAKHAREDDELAAGRARSREEDGEEPDEESDSGDERRELVPRDLPVLVRSPEPIPVPAPLSAVPETVVAPVATPTPPAHSSKASVPAAKPVASPKPQPAAGQTAPNRVAIGPTVKARPSAEETPKAAAKAMAPSTNAKRPAKLVGKPRPAKPAAKNAAARQPVKLAAKAAAKAISTPKPKPAVKKASVKPAAKGKLRKVAVLPRAAKAIVKAKTPSSKLKPAVKARSASLVQAKAAVQGAKLKKKH